MDVSCLAVAEISIMNAYSTVLIYIYAREQQLGRHTAFRWQQRPGAEVRL
jgi:hypothetical protein